MPLSGAAATIAGRYRLGEDASLSGPVARGEQGQVWRLTTEQGTWAVKESFSPQSLQEARDTAGFQNVCVEAGVPAPSVLPDRFGEYVADVDGVFVRVYEWLDLSEPDARIDPVAVGTLLAQLHRVVHHLGGAAVHPWHTEPVGSSRWQDLTSAARARSAPFADRLRELRDELVATEQVLEPMSPVQTCHLDLWADNLRVGTGGLLVIDWENAGPADPSREVAMVLFEFARTDPCRMSALYGAYLDHEGPGRVRRAADFSVAVAQLGHIGEMHLERWLDPTAGPAERQHAESGIDELLGELLTRSTIDDILTVTAQMG